MPLHIPDAQTVDFKEAIIFGFLGAMRWLERPNVLPSITGAKRQAIAGSLILPPMPAQPQPAL